MSVISSRNLFIDSSSDVGQGDNFTLQLGPNGIHAGDGQLIKLSLSYFAMYKSFHGVNTNNCKVKLTADGTSQDLVITNKNYSTVGDIVADFSNSVKNSLLAIAQANGSAATSASVLDAVPLTTETIDSTGDGIMSFQVSFDAAHGITNFILQSFSSEGESYKILGSDRIDDLASTNSSLTCTVESATILKVQGLYPMQRQTDHHIYLRTDLPSTNIETASLSSATGPYQSHTLGSNILGFFEVDHEYIHFESFTDSEFFLVLTQRNLSSIRLFLTDAKNRPLGRGAGSGSKTAAGSGSSQSTLGNLSFKALIRIDTVQATIPRMLNSKPTPRFVNAKKTGVLTHLDSE